MFSLEFFHSFFHADSTQKLLQFLMFFVISHFFFIYRNADTIHIFSASVYDSCNFMQLISENILHFLYLKSMHFLFFIDLFSTVI